jgi:acetolactate decarboxylase
MYRKIFLALCAVTAVAAVLLAVSLAPAPGDDRDTIYQISTIDALLTGVYDGSTPFAELRRHGDFGLGTFDALDGEMVALDGTFYQVTADGRVHTAGDEMTTPFAVVTWFEPDTTQPVGAAVNMTELLEDLDGRYPSQNLFYGILAEGTFSRVTVRSVPAQQKPYPPLAEAVANQTVFELAGIEGSVVGFWSPGYAGGITVPGYHLHFISADRLTGGHVLDFEMAHGDVMIDSAAAFTLVLPDEPGFHHADLSADREEELREIEQ